MKRILKKGISILLVGAFMVAAVGCGASQKGDKDNQSKGRYIETQIEGIKDLGHVSQMIQLADKSLVVLDATNGVMAKSTDQGKTWETEQVPAMQKLFNKSNTELCGVAMNQEGELYLSYVNWAQAQAGDNQYPEQFEKVDTQGNITPLDLTDIIPNRSTYKMIAAENGKLYTITNGNEVYEIDVENKTAKQLFDTQDANFVNINILGNQLVAVTNERAYIYDIESGKTNADDSVLNENVTSQLSDFEKMMAFAKGQEEGTIYIADAAGVYQHAIGGSVMEQLINGELTTLGNPAEKVADILQLNDKEFLIAYQSGTICSYKYDATVSTVPRQQLNVYSLTNNETARQAISVMQKNNQDVFVKLEIGMSGDDGMTAADAIKNLNTKIAAGEGPDVILLDGMPVDSYIEKGTLMDMTKLMKKLESNGKYFENILHVYDKDGVYAVPFKYLIPVMTGDKDSLSQIKNESTLAEQTESISETGTTKTALGTFAPRQVLKKLYQTSSATWLNKKGSVDEEKIKEYLEVAKRIYEADQKNLSDADITNYKDRPIYEEDEKVKVNEMNSSFMQEAYQVDDQLLKETQMTYGNLCGMLDFEMMEALLQTKTEQDYAIAVGQSTNSFVPNGVVGIYAGTKEKELAEEFVTTLLSTEVQQTKLSEGFPVNEDAFDAWSVEPENSGYSIGISDMNGGDTSLDVSWPTQQAFDDLKTKIKKLDKACLMDTMIQETVFQLGTSALTGEKSIEDCLNDIMQKISIYNEE